MRIGVVVPQGWFMEYRGWRPEAAWARTVAVAQQADGIGFESIWLYDHFHTVPGPAGRDRLRTRSRRSPRWRR